MTLEHEGAGGVDAHHHLWDPADGGHSWLLAREHAAIRRRYDVADLRAVLPPGMGATVLVQALASTAESERLLAVAAGSDLIAGVVGWADLTAPGVGDELERLRSRPGGDRLVGVRHLAQDEPDPGWLARPDVARGIATAGRHGLVVDLLVRAPQRAAALTAARAAPDVAFVLDHAGKPGISDAEWEPWASFVAELAALPNVSCKLSGLLTEAAPSGRDVATLRPYADLVLRCFGADRVMFGSDWPVCELAGGYPAVRTTTEGLLADLLPTERAAVLGATARRVYGL
ncbi:amidohydrolase family protein [Pseudonocardia xinjiangensis]|uniref:amidohydrolase family protein n=1 Tax=Pseudonocardia xinjiangensis TaxID=75289 RepID=UPI0028A92A86|nr:amidohydrolase family protein [Pseudonocardia xinjiangensis]